MEISADSAIGSVVEYGKKMSLFDNNDIVMTDARFAPYANVVYTHQLKGIRKTILRYLEKIGIYSAGRYGRWAYLWSDQAFRSGVAMTNKIRNN